MHIDSLQLGQVLGQFNPWWSGRRAVERPLWRRAAFDRLYRWLKQPPARRAIMLSGARQVGKTTMLGQAIDELLRAKVAPANILYATFDHPMLKVAGIEAVIAAWREREPIAAGPTYLFLDELQFVRDWQVWIKHQVDFAGDCRIVFTGSAAPLLEQGQESGVGRWYTIKVATLSFWEYLHLRGEAPASLDIPTTLSEIFTWKPGRLLKTSERAADLPGLFHDYLARGGFPQTAKVETIAQAQQLMREDIVDKVLKRDMTALFGVRRVLDLEHLFLYLCMNNGGLLSFSTLCENLEIKRPTAYNFISLLEAIHLVCRLPKYGFGKDVLRAKSKVFLSDPAIAPAVMLQGRSLLQDARALGAAVETAVLKHALAAQPERGVRFSYWQSKSGHEVDLVSEQAGVVSAIEVKYRNQIATQDVRGLMEMREQKKPQFLYLISRSIKDIGPLPQRALPIMRIPAPLLCYWLGASETSSEGFFSGGFNQGI